MAELTVQRVSKAGIADMAGALEAAAALGDSVDNASGLLVVMGNGDASPHTLTVAAPTATTDCGNFGSLPVADLTLVVAAGDIGFLTIPPGYRDSDNLFSWTYDGVTDVTIGVFSLAP
jgi:hypothetical protein